MVALTGDAHLQEPETRELPSRPGVFGLFGNWPRDDAYWQALVDRAPAHDIGLVWGGNQHNMAYFFQAAYEFDFMSRQVNKIIPSFQLMPLARIRKRFLELGLDELPSMLTRLKATPDTRVVVIGTPPPKKNNEALRAMLHSEPFFIAWAGQIGDDVSKIKITLPHIRLKLWYLLQEMLADMATKNDATFLPVPRNLQDDEGYLRQDFWRQDVTHANEAYGAIMLDHVLKELVR